MDMDIDPHPMLQYQDGTAITFAVHEAVPWRHHLIPSIEKHGGGLVDDPLAANFFIISTHVGATTQEARRMIELGVLLVDDHWLSYSFERGKLLPLYEWQYHLPGSKGQAIKQNYRDINELALGLSMRRSLGIGGDGDVYNLLARRFPHKTSEGWRQFHHDNIQDITTCIKHYIGQISSLTPPLPHTNSQPTNAPDSSRRPTGVSVLEGEEPNTTGGNYIADEDTKEDRSHRARDKGKGRAIPTASPFPASVEPQTPPQTPPYAPVCPLVSPHPEPAISPSWRSPSLLTPVESPHQQVNPDVNDAEKMGLLASNPRELYAALAIPWRPPLRGVRGKDDVAETDFWRPHVIRTPRPLDDTEVMLEANHSPAPTDILAMATYLLSHDQGFFDEFYLDYCDGHKFNSWDTWYRRHEQKIHEVGMTLMEEQEFQWDADRHRKRHTAVEHVLRQPPRWGDKYTMLLSTREVEILARKWVVFSKENTYPSDQAREANAQFGISLANEFTVATLRKRTNRGIRYRTAAQWEHRFTKSHRVTKQITKLQEIIKLQETAGEIEEVYHWPLNETDSDDEVDPTERLACK